MNEENSVWLHTFFDAINASDACRHLEAAGIPFFLNDLGTPSQGIFKFRDLPPVVLEVFVKPHDLTRAQTCLHETMRLFPDREVDPRLSEPEPDEVFSSAIQCDTPADAETACAFLKEQGIWGKTTRIVDDQDSTWISYSVEVKGKDVERAINVLDRCSESL